MPYSDGSSILLTVWCVGVGGAVLALSCLLLESLPRRRYGRSMAAVAALISTCGACVCATGYPPEVWGPIAGLGFVCTVAWATHFPAFLRITRRLAKPRPIWILLLIASPLYALYSTYGLNSIDNDPELFNEIILSRNEVPEFQARTDRGTELKLYRFVVSEEADRAEQQWIADDHLECHVIRTAELDPSCNCHGWVFTGGLYALRTEDIDKILVDNGYQLVDDPREGDIIVYRDSRGTVLHTGLVQDIVNPSLVLIESKWGPLGRFIHPPEYQPYGTNYAYYRSQRSGHQLQVVTLPEEPTRGSQATYPKKAPANGA